MVDSALCTFCMLSKQVSGPSKKDFYSRLCRKLPMKGNFSCAGWCFFCEETTRDLWSVNWRCSAFNFHLLFLSTMKNSLVQVLSNQPIPLEKLLISVLIKISFVV